MDKKLIDLYGRYIEGAINRRAFLRKLTVLAGSTTAAWALLSVLEKDNLGLLMKSIYFQNCH